MTKVYPGIIGLSWELVLDNEAVEHYLRDEITAPYATIPEIAKALGVSEEQVVFSLSELCRGEAPRINFLPLADSERFTDETRFWHIANIIG